MSESPFTIATAYEPVNLPEFGRLFDLLEAPQGAMSLLAGLTHHCDGGPLSIVV